MTAVPREMATVFTFSPGASSDVAILLNCSNESKNIFRGGCVCVYVKFLA